MNDTPLATDPPMTVADAFDRMDGIYACIKDRNSVFLWANENFASLVGQTVASLVGTGDTRAEHVAHDKAVMASGVPLLNFQETIDVPAGDGRMSSLEIVTQKGLLRRRDNREIIGITVCFAKRFPDASRANELITRLGMTPASVGGHIALGERAHELVATGHLPARFIGERALFSTNYFLLKAGEVLRLHALNADEQWFFHEGSAIRLHMFSETGHYDTIALGGDLDQGQVWRAVVPHNHWFGAELLGPGYGLVSCSLAPGFDQQDSVAPTEQERVSLQKSFPNQHQTLCALTSGDPKPLATKPS